jgi:electron transfer flavoprotein alpha subunit
VSTDVWAIVAGEGLLGGLVAAARGLGGSVTAAVVGPRALAVVAAAGPDAVRWFPVPDGAPPEALAGAVADEVAAAAPRAVLCLGDPPSRAVWAVAASRLGAAAVDGVTQLRTEGDLVVVVRPTADGKAIETLEVAGSVAAVVDAADERYDGAPAAVTPAPAGSADAADPAIRVLAAEVEADPSTADLLHADRVVGVGRGLRKRDDLPLVERLASALHAAVACSLPLADDLRWFDASHVVGSSTQRISPSLYLAVGVSGQPQHMSGVRGAKVVVAVNSDPEAPILRHCDYAIVGDLYEVVPALVAALDA